MHFTVKWEIDDAGFAMLSDYGEYARHPSEFFIDRKSGLFLGESVESAFVLWRPTEFRKQSGGVDWNAINKVVDQKLEQMKIWIEDHVDDMTVTLPDDGTHVEVEYSGYRLLKAGLERRSIDHHDVRYVTLRDDTLPFPFEMWSTLTPEQLQECIQQALENWKRIESYGESWHLEYGTVNLVDAMTGLTLGQAHTGSIESDCDAANRAELVKEAQQEAYAQAKDNLGRLKQRFFPPIEDLSVRSESHATVRRG